MPSDRCLIKEAEAAGEVRGQDRARRRLLPRQSAQDGMRLVDSGACLDVPGSQKHFRKLVGSGMPPFAVTCYRIP